MANKREFKKFVDSLGGSLCDEMMYAYYTVEGADKEAISTAVTKVLAATEAARVNSNIYFDRGPKSFEDAKEYSKAKDAFFKKLFKKLATEYQQELSAALKEFNGAIPATEKAKNKEVAAK